MNFLVTPRVVNIGPLGPYPPLTFIKVQKIFPSKKKSKCRKYEAPQTTSQ